MVQINRHKIGRNTNCPCGSGKKYKYCHLKNTQPNVILPHLLRKNAEEHQVKEIQRKQQQGLSKPIISTKTEDHRVVVVGNKIYYGCWLTFHDFLNSCIKIIIGEHWGNEELKKPYPERHPLIKLYDMICSYQKKFVHKIGKINSALFSLSAYSYAWLSYNLYLIFHHTTNIDFQNKLLSRLRQINQFVSAIYETYVAAIFIKAGFIIDYENESDSSTSHCEFTAIHKETGQSFSIEAKFRTRKNFMSPNQGSEGLKIAVESQLTRALNKRALHSRIIFIDLNLPQSEIEKYKTNNLAAVLKKHEYDHPNTPPAYVFITNYPLNFEEDGINYNCHRQD